MAKASRILLILAALAVTIVLIYLVTQKQNAVPGSSISEPEIIYTGETFVMDTFVTQKVYAPDGEAVIHEVEKLFQDLEAEYSAYQPQSITGKINASAGLSPVMLTEEQFGIVKRCYDFSKDSGGMFDLTIAPLVKAWGITAESPYVPTADQISVAQGFVGYENVTLDEEKKTVFLDRPGVALDFGGTVKGLAVERALATYKESGVTGAILSLGGNVTAIGTKPENEPFTIGLRDPNGKDSEYFAVLQISDKVIATSGGYERYFEENGKKYHHILDPKTGYPAESDLLSVTVIGDDGLQCDYLSTLLFMQGMDGVKKALANPDYSIIAVDKVNKVWVSEGVKGKVTLVEGLPYTKH